MRRIRTDRLRLLLVCVLAGLGILWLRAAQLTILQHEKHRKKADRQQKELLRIPSLRGEIRDRFGTPLALSVEGSSLAIDPKHLGSVDSLALALEEHGIMPVSRVRELLDVDEKTRFVWITRKAIPEAAAQSLEKRFGLALIRRPEPKRLYPFGEAAAAVVGATGVDGEGLVGVEGLYQQDLVGVDGKMIDFGSGARKRHSGPGRVVLAAPKVGATVELTLDSRFQQIVDAHLKEEVRRQGAKGGAALLIDPRTGEILALSSTPGFDPAAIETADSLALRNWAVTENYEPGSTYKLVAFAAALEAGRIRPDDRIDCCNGLRRVPGGVIRDHEPYGLLYAWEVLAHSSNIGTGIIAGMVGEEGFYRMERLLGFGVATDVEIPGEERGWIPDPSSWSHRSLVTQAFGQEISCTVMQLTMAFAAVANGGLLMRPYLVRKVRTEDGTVIEHREPEIIRRAILPETAKTLREMMRLVVTEGTGKKAEVEGLLPAGKTGTAQRFIQEEGRYSGEQYVASFVGFAPYDHPRWLCAVVLDEPASSIWGGSVAAPVFARIIEDVAQVEVHDGRGRLRAVAASPEMEPVAHVPRIDGLPSGLARKMVKQEGLLPRLVGSGQRVLRAVPAAGSRCRPGDVVTLVLCDGDGDSARTPGLPELTGLALRDAVACARWHGLDVDLEGSGWVVAQDPPPGTVLDGLSRIHLRLAADSCRAFAYWLAETR